jgi:phage baseplate assembly protein W
MPSKLRKKVNTFVDISLAFEPNPITNDLTVLLDARAINNSLKNLILIAPTEVPFDRDIGSSVREYLFDLIDIGTAGLLQVEIERSIRFGEPRVDLQKVVVDPKPENNVFMVSIFYKIIGYEEIYSVEQILEPTR